MGKYYYHPLGENAPNVNIFTGHSERDAGKLDFNYNDSSIEGTPFYAMADGEIVFCGSWNDGNVAIVQKCNDSRLGITFYIRYLHGINNQELLGTVVKKGTELGKISNNGGKYQSHLHIDFSLESNGYSPVLGKLNRSDINNMSWEYTYSDGTKKTFNLSSKVDNNIITNWEAQEGHSGDIIGYLWLVFAQAPQYLTPSSSSVYKGAIDVSEKFSSDSDWDALYGMLAYEESVLFDEFETNEEARAILEWIVRVFRNRLFSGSSINSICLWNSGEPGCAIAEQKASQVPENIRQFAKNIISGKDYFLVEKYAKKYKYGDWPNEDKWYDRLYSADTFYGGSSARWPESTLAALPFSYGPYFFFEGEFTNEVLSKFWPNGTGNDSAYPNPYRTQHQN